MNHINDSQLYHSYNSNHLEMITFQLDLFPMIAISIYHSCNSNHLEMIAENLLVYSFLVLPHAYKHGSTSHVYKHEYMCLPCVYKHIYTLHVSYTSTYLYITYLLSAHKHTRTSVVSFTCTQTWVHHVDLPLYMQTCMCIMCLVYKHKYIHHVFNT